MQDTSPELKIMSADDLCEGSADCGGWKPVMNLDCDFWRPFPPHRNLPEPAPARVFEDSLQRGGGALSSWTKAEPLSQFLAVPTRERWLSNTQQFRKDNSATRLN